MKCPHCDKEVHGMTGLQEIQAYQKHLKKCKKFLKVDGGPHEPHNNMLHALSERAGSGQ